MPSKQSDKKSSIQTHPADAIERAPFDRKEHLKHARQKKKQKPGKMRGIVAYQIQLNQEDVQLHGPRHLKAAIEQHASTLSSVGTKAHDANTWEADPAFMPNAPAKRCLQVGQAQWHLEGVKRMRTVPLSEMSTDPIG